MFIRWKQKQTESGRYAEPKYLTTRHAAYLVRSVRIDGKPRQEQHYIAAYTEYGSERLRWQWKRHEWERNRRFWAGACARLYLTRYKFTRDEWTKIVGELDKRVPVTPANYADYAD
jgi:hypothetical protein